MITAYQEKVSASRISGTITVAMFRAVSAFASLASWYSTMAHWRTKQISATVATDRPTKTLDSQVSNSTMNVGPRQHGSKGAAEDVGGAQEHQDLDAENPALRTRRHLPEAAMEQHPQGDVGGADDQQKTPPDRNRV